MIVRRVALACATEVPRAKDARARSSLRTVGAAGRGRDGDGPLRRTDEPGEAVLSLTLGLPGALELAGAGPSGTGARDAAEGEIHRVEVAIRPSLDPCDQRVRTGRTVLDALREVVVEVLEDDEPALPPRRDELGRKVAGGLRSEDEAVSPTENPHELEAREMVALRRTAHSEQSVTPGLHPLLFDEVVGLT